MTGPPLAPVAPRGNTRLRTCVDDDDNDDDDDDGSGRVGVVGGRAGGWFSGSLKVVGGVAGGWLSGALRVVRITVSASPCLSDKANDASS